MGRYGAKSPPCRDTSFLREHGHEAPPVRDDGDGLEPLTVVYPKSGFSYRLKTRHGVL